VRNVLAGWGIARDEYVIYDGSGLSRYNYVSPAALVKVLTRMYADMRHRNAFLATFPIGGEDGTLQRRMVGTAAEHNVRAKTGSISNVRSLSGYVTTSNGETLAFSMIANNFTVAQSEVDAALDLAVSHLAEFSR
jgi:D-alanyl-D-alanine carboxypeptidase/D-alanyl-D-alanine-endopeptidase (penicillin-binding protein 4)